MKTYSLTALLLVAAASATPAWSAVDVGVGITIREPGVYGRIEIGTQAPPPLVYAKPVIYQQPAVVVARQPIYLYVPPGHAKDWGKHCKHYDACNQPVYFVQESWVQQTYEQHHGKSKGNSGKANKGNSGKSKD